MSSDPPRTLHQAVVTENAKHNYCDANVFNQYAGVTVKTLQPQDFQGFLGKSAVLRCSITIVIYLVTLTARSK
jgi:hypothetical protein